MASVTLGWLTRTGISSETLYARFEYVTTFIQYTTQAWTPKVCNGTTPIVSRSSPRRAKIPYKWRFEMAPAGRSPLARSPIMRLVYVLRRFTLLPQSVRAGSESWRRECTAHPSTLIWNWSRTDTAAGQCGQASWPADAESAAAITSADSGDGGRRLMRHEVNGWVCPSSVCYTDGMGPPTALQPAPRLHVQRAPALPPLMMTSLRSVSVYTLWRHYAYTTALRRPLRSTDSRTMRI